VDLGPIASIAVMIIFFAALIRLRRRRGRVGPGATGAVYDMLNEEKRKAIELIVEERAEERDSETADGDLPQLEHPVRRP
jgi:hypothetical protein